MTRIGRSELTSESFKVSKGLYMNGNTVHQIILLFTLYVDIWHILDFLTSTAIAILYNKISVFPHILLKQPSFLLYNLLTIPLFALIGEPAGKLKMRAYVYLQVPVSALN